MSDVMFRLIIFLCCFCSVSCSQELDEQLADAVWHDDVVKVRKLVSQGGNPNGKVHDGWTPFIIAAREGKTASIAVLLDMSVDPNIFMQGGHTPISWAAYNGHADIVELLLKHGADPCVHGDGGMTAKEAAMKYQHTDIAILLPACF